MTRFSLPVCLLLLLLLPHAAGAATVFINEIHYDNSGGDVGEGIEIAAAAGTSLDGWTLLFYNGSNGSQYGSIGLGGVIGNQQNGFGTLFFAVDSLQNGGPDGVALVDSNDLVRQFLSYEGSFVATSGLAAGLSSTDIGVSEAADTAPGLSLQLVGTGTVYQDFSWIMPSMSSYGSVNSGQDFAVVPVPGGLVLLASALGLVSLRQGLRRAQPVR